MTDEEDDDGLGPLVYVVVYLVALSVHAHAVVHAPYGDEAFHYAAATRLWQPDSNVHVFYASESLDFNLLFWQRPVFFLLLAPAAAISFDAFQMFHTLLVSALPVVIVGLARSLGVARLSAGAVGLSAGIHPLLVVWTTRMFPDGLAATFALTALLLWTRGRHAHAVAVALAATWIKETAGLVLIALVVLWVFPAVARRLRLSPAEKPAGPWWGAPVALAVAPLPIMYSLYLGGRFPGWVRDGNASTLLNVLVGSVLVFPFLVASLAFPRARLVGAMAIGYLAFFFGYAVFYNHQVQGWYVAIPLSLALVASAAAAHGLDEEVRRRFATRARPFLTILLALLVAVSVLPTGSAGRSIISGGLPGGPASLGATSAFMHLEGADMVAAIDAFERTTESKVVVVDASWLYLYYPFGFGRDRVTFARSDFLVPNNQSWEPVIDAIETWDTVTVIGADDGRRQVGLTLREVYQECTLFANPSYQLVRGAECAGRGAEFLGRLPDII